MSGLTETVAEEVQEQVDVGDIVTGDSVTDQLDGEKLGRAVGESVGSLLGRRVADLLFGRLLSKLGMGDDDESTRTGRIARGVGIALARTLAQPQFRDAIESSLREVIADRESSDDQQIADESDGEKSTDDSQSSNGEAANLDAESLQSLKRETYRDLLERMDYSELQSLAKDTGVKANLKRETLVDELVDAFGDESEAGEAEDAEAASANTEESAGADESESNEDESASDADAASEDDSDSS